MKNHILFVLLLIASTQVSAGLYHNAYGHRDGSTNASNINVECSFHGWPSDGLLWAEQNRNNEGETLLGPHVANMFFDVNAGIPKSTSGWFNVRQETFEFTREILDVDYSQRSAQFLARETESGDYGSGSGRTKFRWSNWNRWQIHLSDVSYNIANGASRNDRTKNVYLYMEHIFGAEKYRKWINTSGDGGADNLTDELFTDNSGVQKLVTGGRMYGKWYAKFNRPNGSNDVITWGGGEYNCTLNDSAVPDRSAEIGVLSKSAAFNPEPFGGTTPRIKAWLNDERVEGTLAQYRDSNGKYVDSLEKDGKYGGSGVDTGGGSCGSFAAFLIGLTSFLRRKLGGLATPNKTSDIRA